MPTPVPHQHTPARRLPVLLATLALGGMATGQNIPIRIPPASDTSYYQPSPRRLHDACFYIQPSLMLPTGRFGQQPSREATVLDPYRNTTGAGAAMGYGFEMGYRRAFVVHHAEASRIYPFWGLAASGAYHPMDWTTLGGNWTRHDKTGIVQAAGVIHMGAALKHNAKWVLEAHGGVLLPVAMFYPKTSMDVADRPINFSVKVEEYDKKPGFTAGITWRTRRFRIGAEYFRHQSSVDLTYLDDYDGSDKPRTNRSGVEGFFDWQALRTFIGVQF